MASKQVIVMRKMAKGCRTGKYCAQAAHASLGALLSLADNQCDKLVISLQDPFVRDWLIGRFTKVTVYVETDDELSAIYNKAKEYNIAASIITDAGLTEFGGVPTLTAVGIGPDESEKIDKITGHVF